MSGIVSAVPEDHGAPEHGVEPMTHEVPGGAAPQPVRLDDLGDILDRDLVDRDVADDGENVSLEAPPPGRLRLRPAPARPPHLDHHLEDLGEDGNPPLLAAEREGVAPLVPNAKVVHALLTGRGERDDRVAAETNVTTATVDDDALHKSAATAGTDVEVETETVGVPAGTGLTADAIRQAMKETLSPWVPPCSGRGTVPTAASTSPARKGDNLAQIARWGALAPLSAPTAGTRRVLSEPAHRELHPQFPVRAFLRRIQPLPTS